MPQWRFFVCVLATNGTQRLKACVIGGERQTSTYDR